MARMAARPSGVGVADGSGRRWSPRSADGRSGGRGRAVARARPSIACDRPAQRLLEHKDRRVRLPFCGSTPQPVSGLPSSAVATEAGLIVVGERRGDGDGSGRRRRTPARPTV